MTTGTHIAPLRRADIPELRQFLINTGGERPTFAHFAHDVISWKYFDGPRGPSQTSVSSLIARSADKIIGHIGMCPRQFVVWGNPATPVSTMHAIDWHCSAAHPGSGAFLMLQACATSKTQYGIGGSVTSRALFPRLGFEQKPQLGVFRKVLAPFHRFRTTGQGCLHKWAGTAKDMVSVWRARPPKVPQTVQLRSAPAFTPEIDYLQQRSSLRLVTCQRDHLLLNYFLRCPLAGFSGWTLHTSHGMIGFALLKITPHGGIQLGSIVDCWLETEDLSCWQAAVAALTERLRSLSADCVTCYAGPPSLHAALLLNRFAKLGERNVYLRDKRQSLPRDVPFALSMLEGDHAIC
jgi:hypothetical protein